MQPGRRRHDGSYEVNQYPSSHRLTCSLESRGSTVMDPPTGSSSAGQQASSKVACTAAISRLSGLCCRNGSSRPQEYLLAEALWLLQIASLFDVNEKSWARIAGTIIDEKSLPPARTGLLVASRFLSRLTGLSLNRKLFTG